LEYYRDEEVEAMGIDVKPFEKEKNKIRKILIGSCKLMDPKLEKNGAFEFTPAVSFFLINLFRKMISSSNATI
jgi:hypothetical protein